MIRIDGQEYKEMPSDAVFAEAKDVWLENLQKVSVLPDMPRAKYVWLRNLSQVSVLPEMPKANSVWLDNLSQVSVLPEMPNATDVWLDNKLKKLFDKSYKKKEDAIKKV